MALPTTREQFKQFCLRQLGKTVTRVNMSDEQIEDTIDLCLSYYMDYHFDGSEKVYYKHQITQDDMNNKYITLPDNIMGAVSIFDISSALSGSSTNMFSINYQIIQNDMWTFMSGTLVPYYMTMQHLRLLEQILVGHQPIRFNRHRNRLHLDMNWERFSVGQYLIVEAYQVVDPAEFPDVWKDRWLIRYTVANLKKLYGFNLTKYIGAPMPGNIQFNGQKMYDDAVLEIDKLEAEMINSYSLPVSDMIG